MAIDPADRKFRSETPFVNTNIGGTTILDRLPAPARVYIDPTYGIPTADVMKMIAVAEGGGEGRWDTVHGKARGQFRFLGDTEIKVAEYLDSLGILKAYDEDGNLIPTHERPPIEQEAMFRALAYMPQGSIPGVTTGLGNWLDSSGQFKKDGTPTKRYLHTWNTIVPYESTDPNNPPPGVPGRFSDMDRLRSVYNIDRDSYNRLLEQFTSESGHKAPYITPVRSDVYPALSRWAGM